jgi:hypothetical protein
VWKCCFILPEPLLLQRFFLLHGVTPYILLNGR